MINIVFGYSKKNINNQNEFLIPLYYYLCDLQIKCNIIEYIEDINPLDLNLHIGIFNHIHLSNMPKNYIYFNIEPENNLNNDMIIKIKNAKAVFTYLNYTLCNNNVFYYPFPYHISIENLYNVNIESIAKNIDVLFYGCLNNNRIFSINLLKENNIHVYCPNFNNNVFNIERDTLIYSSKIVLIQNFYTNDIDIPRITYLSSNKIFFIYLILDNEVDFLNDMFDNLIVKCNLKNLCNIVKYYLLNENERSIKINELYNCITTKYNINKFITNDVLHYIKL
jgi:hypothetical protein